MNKRTFVALICLSAVSIFAQQALNNEAVLKLVKAGLGDDLIVSTINAQPGSYVLSANDLIALKAGGVSDKVMAAMITKGNSASVSAAAPTAVPAAATSPVSEVGVYYKKGAAWVDVEPEVVSFKTGGVLKSVASQGIVKGDVNGHLKGAHSKLSLNTPIELLVYTPEGTAITEYQLLLLHEQGDSREYRTVTGGVFHISGGATRDAQAMEGKKIAPRTYSVPLNALKAGAEYGLLPPSSGDSTGASGRLGKLYTFHVIE